MTRNSLLDSRRLVTAVDRLDAVSAEDRHAAAKHIFDVCIHHVTRVRRTHPSPPNRGHGRPAHYATPTPEFVFDLIHPHIYRIARRLDRAMRFAETSPHPADASALIVAVDAQGALAALFAVAQNAGVSASQLDLLALPLRKRSAPALLRTLFSPDMRVANAAKKALRQVTAIASCQNTPWISTIRSAISLRSAPAVTRSVQLRNLLSRLAEILRLVIAHAAAAAANPASTPRKRPSRSSLGNLVSRPRQSLNHDRRSSQRSSSLKHRSAFKHFFRRKNATQLTHSTSHVTLETDSPDTFDKRRFRNQTDTNSAYRTPRTDSIDDMHSIASAIMSTGGSYPGSLFSAVTESAAGTLFSRSQSHTVRTTASSTIKRDAATAMYIFERLLTKRINPDLEDRVKVIDTLAEMAASTFPTSSSHGRKPENLTEFQQVMKSVLTRYGQNVYSIVLDILFRPVREADANRIGVFSFQEAGIMDIAGLETSLPRRRPTDFPLSAICLPNMDCTTRASFSCNSILKAFLHHVPPVCSERMALLTGTINSVFLNCSEALARTAEGCKWDVRKLTGAVDSLIVLVSAVPHSTDMALDVIIAEPVTLRLVLETCIRSVGATGRLMAQNSARPSAPKLSDDGTLHSLRSWRALVTILPNTSSWAESPSYSSSILFLAQVARRAALISVIQGYRRDRSSGVKLSDEDDGEDTITMGTSVARIVGEFEGLRTRPEDANDQVCRTMSVCGIDIECDDENLLVTELYKSIVAMINVPGTSPVDVFFQLYRTVVYLYANDLKKQRKRVMRSASTTQAPLTTSGGTGVVLAGMTSSVGEDKRIAGEGVAGQMASSTSESRSQSEEDAKGVLVENIAVDGQLPTRALRKAVMASELDLGEYFDIGQPPSLQHLNQQYSGLALGAHTFEEFAHALAIVLGTLWNKSVMDKLENPQEAVAMIARDVQRSGSSYLKKVYRRARVIRRREMTESNVDLRNAKYEERIRRLEEQVASLTNMVQTSLEESMLWTRKKSLPRVLGLTTDGATPRGDRVAGRNDMHDFICSPSKCFCVK